VKKLFEDSIFLEQEQLIKRETKIIKKLYFIFIDLWLVLKYKKLYLLGVFLPELNEEDIPMI